MRFEKTAMISPDDSSWRFAHLSPLQSGLCMSDRSCLRWPNSSSSSACRKSQRERNAVPFLRQSALVACESSKHPPDSAAQAQPAMLYAFSDNRLGVGVRKAASMSIDDGSIRPVLARVPAGSRRNGHDENDRIYIARCTYRGCLLVEPFVLGGYNV